MEQGRPLDEHVDADAVADRHLVDEPAEIPLQLGHPRLEDVAPALEVDDLALGRRGRRGLIAGAGRGRRRDAGSFLIPLAGVLIRTTARSSSLTARRSFR